MIKKRKGLSVRTNEFTNEVVFRLYDTDILELDHGVIRLNTNGWKTNHTKNCMNDNLPQGYKVFQKNYTWYVDTPNGTVEFIDNMELKVA